MGMVIYSMNSTLIVHKDPFIACKGLVSNTPGETLGLFMVEMKPSGSTKP